MLFEYKMLIDQVIDVVKGKGIVVFYIGNFEEVLEFYNEGFFICDLFGLLVQKVDLLINKSIVLQNQRKFEEVFMF